MSEVSPESMEQIIHEDGRYPPEAYAFLHDALTHAAKEVHGAGQNERRHVSGQELCRALRNIANERWGMLARTVLAKWNIRQTLDFGNMVYLLIEHEMMRKTDEDSLEDFRDVYDFDTAFSAGCEFELKE